MSADETMALTSVFMDRIAELERAAETTRAEHAAAIKRAEELEARLVDRETKCTEWASTAGEHAAKLAAAEDEAYQLGIAIEDHRAEHAAAANEAAIDALASQDELAEEMEAHKLTREAVKAAVDEWNGVSGALGLATARIRELEGEREELLGLVAGARWTDPNTGAEVRVGDTWKAKGAPSAIAASVTYEVLALKRRRDGTTWAHVITPSEFATTIPAGALVNRFAIVARIEKAAKGTT